VKEFTDASLDMANTNGNTDQGIPRPLIDIAKGRVGFEEDDGANTDAQYSEYLAAAPLLAIGCEDGRVFYVDVLASPARIVEVVQRWVNIKSPIVILRYARQTVTAATADGSLRLWTLSQSQGLNAQNSTFVDFNSTQAGNIESVDLTPSARGLGVSFDQGNILIYKVDTGASVVNETLGELYTIKTSKSPRIAISRKRLATGGSDFTVRVWNPISGGLFSYETHTCVFTISFFFFWVCSNNHYFRFLEHSDAVTNVLFRPAENDEGRIVASSGRDGRIVTINVDVGVIERQYAPMPGSAVDAVNSLAFSADGSLLIAGRESGRVDIVTAEPPGLWEIIVNNLATFAVSRRDDEVVNDFLPLALTNSRFMALV
jgi:hypothetical protein